MNTTERVTRFIYEDLLNSPPGLALEPDTSLLIDGLVTSIAAIRLVAFVEDEFQVIIPPEDVTLENFGTIARISDYITRHAP